MSALPSLTIRARVGLAVVVVTTSLVALGAWGWWTTDRGIQTTAALFDRANRATEEAGALRRSISEIRRLEASMIAIGSSNAVEVQRLHGVWADEARALKAAAATLASAPGADPALAAPTKALAGQVDDYVAAIEPVIVQLEGAQIDGPVALAYAEQAADKATALLQSSEAIAKAQVDGVGRIRAEMAADATRLSVWRLALIGATLAIFLPLMGLTLRSIMRPLTEAAAGARRIAQGDLSVRPVVSGRDETAQLMQALADMQGSLSRLVGQVREAARSIHIASAEVAAGNQDLSQRTEQTAGSLQQAASSMVQLNGTVTQSVDATQQANRLAGNAAEVAQRGGSVVADVVTTMDQITSSSHRIADISGVIDGIAFQTNILALNAAVEAARAGDQGRGFAVVASEVRSLAQRSAEAAREIKSLIDASVTRVQAGAGLVGQAGRTMDEIVASVQRVTAIIAEIGQSASEQSSGIGQVSGSVAMLDRMTQQNAALVEQSAAPAESLEQQAQTLSQLVATFRLDAEPA